MAGKVNVMTFTDGVSTFYLTKSSWVRFSSSIEEAALFSDERIAQISQAYETDPQFRSFLVNSGVFIRRGGKYLKHAITASDLSNFIVRRTQLVLI